MRNKNKIKLAIVGIGNCASSLIQGIEFYKHKPRKESIGLTNYDIDGYLPDNIEIVAAFDIDKRKVGKDLKDAIFSSPNCTKVFFDNFLRLKVKVMMGEVLDGVSSHMVNYPEERRFIISSEKPVDIGKVLRKTGAEILISYLPVGSEKAVHFYANKCLENKIAFINSMPVFIASNPVWARKFEERGIPIIGDDIKSQLGATVIHRTLTRLFEDRGIKVDRMYQLNVGGNTDFLNMLNRERLGTKKISKTKSVQSQMEIPLDSDNIHIGPSDYVPWLYDNKICFIRIEGRGFGDIPINVELRLSVEDSPNSAGIAIDAIRCCKLALDRKISGPLISISSYAMKHPPVQYTDTEAKARLADFINRKIER
ncbi:MAG: inositol-3-phosphate synthase [Candidatus Firestonebacteria bacterium]|nr:inositol-3-phosphate synthase [Candidatus Firestonebacteria bacterium]